MSSFSQRMLGRIVGMEPNPARRVLLSCSDGSFEQAAYRCWNWSRRQVGLEPLDLDREDDDDVIAYQILRRDGHLPLRCRLVDRIGNWLFDLNEVWATRRRFR